MDKTIIKSNRIPTIILDQKCALIQGLNEKLAIIQCHRFDYFSSIRNRNYRFCWSCPGSIRKKSLRRQNVASYKLDDIPTTRLVALGYNENFINGPQEAGTMLMNPYTFNKSAIK